MGPDCHGGTFNLNNLFDRWSFEGALDVLASGTSPVPATYTFDDKNRRRLQLDGHGKLLVAKKPEDTNRVGAAVDGGVHRAAAEAGA